MYWRSRLLRRETSGLLHGGKPITIGGKPNTAGGFSIRTLTYILQKEDIVPRSGPKPVIQMPNYFKPF